MLFFVFSTELPVLLLPFMADWGLRSGYCCCSGVLSAILLRLAAADKGCFACERGRS